MKPELSQGQPLGKGRFKPQLLEGGLIVIELRHVKEGSEAEWLTLLPPRGPDDALVECDCEGRTIVTNGAVASIELPVGYKERTCIQCCDVMGSPVDDLGQNGRYLVSGVCSPQAAFVIAARSGILRLECNPGPVGRLVGHTLLVRDLRPLAALLDRLDVLVDRNQEGESGLLIAAWEMIANTHEADADLLSWMAGIDRWRWILSSVFPRELLTFARQWEEKRQSDIETLRAIDRERRDPGASQK